MFFYLVKDDHVHQSHQIHSLNTARSDPHTTQILDNISSDSLKQTSVNSVIPGNFF